MAIEVTCSHCRAGSFPVHESQAGRKAVCPHCGRECDVPVPPAEDASDSRVAGRQAAAAGALDFADDEEHPQSGASRSKSEGGIDLETLSRIDPSLKLAPAPADAPDAAEPPRRPPALDISDEKAWDEYFARTGEELEDTARQAAAEESIHGEHVASDAGAHTVGLLGQKIIYRTILGISLAGLLGGAACGAACWWSWPQALAAGYIGAAAGAGAGFAIGLIFVLAFDRMGSTGLRCPVCGAELAEQVKQCGFCGSKIRYRTWTDPLISEAVYGGWRQVRDVGSVLPASAIFSGVLLLLGGADALWHPAGQPDAAIRTAWYVLEAVLLAAAAVAMVVPVYWTLRKALTDRQWSLPAGMPLQGDSFFAALALPLVAVAYLLPGVTVALLPAGLLLWARPVLARPWRVDAAARLAGRQPGDYIAIWLLMLLWLGGMGVAVLVALALMLLVGRFLPTAEGLTGRLLSVLLRSLAAGVLAAVALSFARAVVHTVGAYGKRLKLPA